MELTYRVIRFNKTLGGKVSIVRIIGARCSYGVTVSELGRSVKAVRLRMKKRGRRFSCVIKRKNKAGISTAFLNN